MGEYVRDVFLELVSRCLAPLCPGTGVQQPATLRHLPSLRRHVKPDPHLTCCSTTLRPSSRACPSPSRTTLCPS